MTDHSILFTSGNLPFGKEAPLATRVLHHLFVKLPDAFRRALRARDTYKDLAMLDSAGLAALGLGRENIARYAAERAGLLAGEGK